MSFLEDVRFSPQVRWWSLTDRDGAWIPGPGYHGNMSEKRRQFVAGPKWGLTTMICFTVAVIVHIATYPRFEITELSFSTCAIVGALLVVTGICVYAAAYVSLQRGLRKGTLVTCGMYAIVRHPLYASSILFIIPGAALAFRSWLLLPMPAVAYVAFRIFIPGEEQGLSEQYGEDFRLYRQRTNAIFPVPRRRGKRS